MGRPESPRRVTTAAFLIASALALILSGYSACRRRPYTRLDPIPELWGALALVLLACAGLAVAV